MRIRKLSPFVANQIAAGEVIERPASVVKELIENAIDAGSKRIDVEIEKGGQQLILLRDNGCGISADDLALAIEAHATSKIKDAEDIANISSLGFRGEALASIASVARLTLKSHAKDATDAWQIQVAGKGQAGELSPCSHPIGTTVEVRDLFFNTPARRRFLRTEKTEFDHIYEVIKRVALSHFNIGITLKHNQKMILHVRAGDDQTARQARVAKIMGKAFAENSLKVEFGAAGLNLKGWVGLPQIARSEITQQYCYINGRMVRDKLINHAIRQAYGQQLEQGKHGAFILHLMINPEMVDVNVHPTKHEVRFCDGRLVHDFIFKSIHNALQTEPKTETVKPAHIEKSEIKSQKITTLPGNSDIHDSKKTLFPKSKGVASVKQQMSAYQSLHPKSNNVTRKRRDANSPLGRILGQVRGRFLLTENNHGLVIVDLSRARESVAYQYLKKSLQDESLRSQPLLVPVSVKLKEEEVRHIEQYHLLLTTLGFDIASSGPQSVTVREVPVVLRDVDMQACMYELLRHLQSAEIDENSMLLGLAKIAGNVSMNLSHDQIEELLVQLEGLSMSDVQAYRELTTQDLDELVTADAT